MKSFVKANWKQMLIAFAVALALATAGIITLFCVQASLGKSKEFIAKSVAFDSNDEKNNGIIDVNDAPSKVASCFCLECNVDDGTGSSNNYPVDKENMSKFAKCTKKALVIDNLESFLWLCEPNINLNGDIGGYLQTANKYEFCYVLKTDLNLVSVDTAGYQYRDREDDTLKSVRFTGIGNCTSGVLMSKWKSETLRKDCITQHGACAQFKGHFDGGGHTITYTVIEDVDNDSLTTYKREKGLFAGLDKATVKNINLNLTYKDTQSGMGEDKYDDHFANDFNLRVGGSVAPYANDSYVTGINVKFNLVTDAAPNFAFGFGGAIGYITNTVLEKTNVNFKTISTIGSELIASKIGIRYAGGVVLGNNGDIVDCKFNFTESRGENDVLALTRFGGIAGFTTKSIYNCNAVFPSVTVKTLVNGGEEYSTTIGLNRNIFPTVTPSEWCGNGGIVGIIGSGANIEGCSATYNETTQLIYSNGGIAGRTGEFPFAYLVAGMPMSNVNPIVIKNCVSYGEILTGKGNMGGILGAVDVYKNDLSFAAPVACEQIGDRGTLPRGVQIINCESKIKRIGTLGTTTGVGGVVGVVSGLPQKTLMDTVNGNTLEGCDDVKLNNYFIMRNCRSYSNVRGNQNVGGLAGYISEYAGRDINNDSDKLDDTITVGRKPVYIEIKDSEVYGNVQATNYVGGGIGYILFQSNNGFTNTKYSFPVTATRALTSFADVGSMLEIDGVNVYGNVEGAANYIGGLLGHFVGGTFVAPTSSIGIDNLTLATTRYGHIRNCNIYGDITGNSPNTDNGNMGGIIGGIQHMKAATLLNCNVYGKTLQAGLCVNVGGVVGCIYSSDNMKIHETTVYGDVQATKSQRIGGMVGLIQAAIVEIGGANPDGTDNGTGCKIYGDVIAGRQYGGIVGMIEYGKFYGFHRKPGLSDATVKGVTIQWCDVYGDVNFVGATGYRNGDAGGIIGWTNAYTDIFNCNVYSRQVVGYTYMGGIVGNISPVAAITSTEMNNDYLTTTGGRLVYRTHVKNVGVYANIIGMYNNNASAKESVFQQGLAMIDNVQGVYNYEPAAIFENITMQTALNFSWNTSNFVGVSHSVLFTMRNYATVSKPALVINNISYQYTSPRVVMGTVNGPSALGSYPNSIVAATNVALNDSTLNASVPGYVTYKPIIAKPGATPGTGEEAFQGFWASKSGNIVINSQNMNVTIKNIMIYQRSGAIDYLVYDGKTRYRCKTILNNGSAVTRDVGTDVSVCGSSGSWNTSIEFETANLSASGAKIVVEDSSGKQYILGL